MIDNAKPKGRRPDQEKADAVLEHGWSLFLKHGVQAVSMEMIAASAGVSKVTAYRHFSDKHALFRAAMQKEMVRLEALQGPAITDEDQPIREALTAFGHGLMSFLLFGPAADFYSVLAAEVRRSPELARAFYDAGPGQTYANLRRLLDRARARGEVRIDDLDQAVDQFLGLLQGYSNFQIALGVELPSGVGSVERRVEGAVDVFLKAYGANV